MEENKEQAYPREERKVYNNELRVVPKVIHNPGKDWFMGAALQSLMSLPEFVNYFAQNRNSFDFNEENKDTHLVVNRMKDFVQAYLHSQGQEINAQELRSIFDQEFPPDQEHDAYDFLLELFDKIQTELDSESNSFENEGYANAHKAWRAYQQTHSSIIDKLFVGMTESVYKCKLCNHEQKTFEEFKEKQLRWDLGNPQAGFIEFAKAWTKTDNISYNCENCKSKADHSVTERLVKLPKYLILVFQRSNPINGRKINELMNYPSSFKMNDYISKKEFKYSLKSIITHEEGNWCCHYSSICCRRRRWVNLTPEECQALRKKEVSKQSSAYILFYATQDWDLIS